MAIAALAWRIRWLKSNGSAVIGIKEIQFRSVSGGSDITSPSSQVIHNGQLNNDPTWVAAHCFDDTTAEYATPVVGNANEYPYWVGVRFPSPVSVVEFTIQNRTTDTTNQASQSPMEFALEYEAPTGIWLTALYVTGQTGWSNNPGGETRVYTVPAITATSTRWGLYCERSAAGNIFSLRELEFHTTVGGAQAATGGTPIAESEFSAAWVKANAYDGTSAGWASTTNRYRSLIGYLFSAAIGVAELKIVARSDDINGVPQTPSDFALVQSADGVLWVPVASYRYITWTTTGQTVVAYVPPYAPDDRISAFSMDANVALGGREDLLTAAGLRSGVALGGQEDRLTAAGLRSQVALGGYPDRIAAAAMRATAAVGGYPDRIAVAAMRACVLFQPVLRARNGPVQIIGG